MQIYRLGNDSGINLTLDTAGSTTQFSDAVNILIIALISLLILLTVGGNTLVILAFFVEKRLRNQSNFFLLNLSIADFILGTFAIPLYVPYLLTGKWLLGKFLCKLWLIVDYTMCTASAFNVALISWDRFLSVTQAVLYRSQQNRPCRTVIKMAAVWILSFLLYGPAIIFWDFVPSTEEIPENICVAGFYYTWYYLLTASAFDFVLPLISISFFNLSIYCNIKKRSRRKMQNSISLPPQKSRKEAKLYNRLYQKRLCSNNLHVLSDGLYSSCTYNYTTILGNKPTLWVKNMDAHVEKLHFAHCIMFINDSYCVTGAKYKFIFFIRCKIFR
uniref:Histamine receptor H4 gene b2 n=1 Tax=Xenopus tropicalis TaxID=8364 RepID=F7D3H9_XENTR